MKHHLYYGRCEFARPTGLLGIGSGLLLLLGSLSAQAMIDFDGLGEDFSDAENHVTAVSPNGAILAGQSLESFSGGVGSTVQGRPYLKQTPYGPVLLGNYDWQQYPHVLPLDLSASGKVLVGQRGPAVSFPSEGPQAFFWTAQTGVRALSDYGNFSAAWSTATAVSWDGGAVAGWGQKEENSPAMAFVWSPTSGTNWIGEQFGTSDPYASTASDLSARGDIVLGTLTPEGGGQSQAYLWSAATGLFMPDAWHNRWTTGKAMNSDGSTVIGSWGDAQSGPPGVFRWQQGNELQDLGRLAPQDRLEPIGLSDDGRTVVGNYIRPDMASGEEKRGSFIWLQGRGMFELSEILKKDYGFEHRLAGWDLGTVVDVSSDGKTMVGRGKNPQGLVEDWRAVATRPELLADGNFDGHVNFGDFALLRRQFGHGRFRSQGDFDTSGIVDFQDFVTLRKEFGKSHPFTLLDVFQPVPEPSGLLLAVVVLTSLVCCARGRRLGGKRNQRPVLLPLIG